MIRKTLFAAGAVSALALAAAPAFAQGLQPILGKGDGGTATFTQGWQAIAAQPAALGTATTPQASFNTAANTALTTVSANTNGHAVIKGIIRVTVTGTIIPQVSLSVAAAAVVGANSYFRISPLGGAAVVSVGNWS